MPRAFVAASFPRFDAGPWWLLAALAFVAAGCAPAGRKHQAASTALARHDSSALTRASSVFDVTASGASGSDDVDDTVAIQAAIDRAAQLPGSTVSLPAGTYYLSDQPPIDHVALNVRGAQRLTFAGSGVGSTILILRSKPDAHLLSLAECRHVQVKGLTIDGARAGRVDTHGIRVADSSDISLTNLEIRSTAHYGIGLQHGTLQKIRIEGVRIDDTGGDGIDFKNTAGNNDALVLHDVHVSRPGQTSDKQTGIDVRGPAELSAITVTGVRSGATGVRFREDGPETGPGGHRSTLTQFQIEGDEGSTGVAIAADHVTVTSGTVRGTDTGVILLGNADEVRGVSVNGARLAFRIAEGSRDAIVASCRGDSSRAGVWLEGIDATVRASSFAANRACGICVRPSASGPRLLSNNLSNNGVAIDDPSAAATPLSP